MSSRGLHVSVEKADRTTGYMQDGRQGSWCTPGRATPQGTMPHSDEPPSAGRPGGTPASRGPRCERARCLWEGTVRAKAGKEATVAGRGVESVSMGLRAGGQPGHSAPGPQLGLQISSAR